MRPFVPLGIKRHKSSQPGPRQSFKPTSTSWREQQAQRLGLPKPFDLPERQSKLDLGKPLEVNTIAGGGNCLYRSISLGICGTQNHHEQVRALIMDFLLENHTKFPCYVGGEGGMLGSMSQGTIWN